MNEDEKTKFKIITDTQVEFIDLHDDTISPLPLIYPRMNESFNFFDMVSFITNNLGAVSDDKVKAIMKKNPDVWTDEEKKYISENTNVAFLDSIKETLPKIVDYFAWSINKHYNYKLNENELAALEKKILLNIDVVFEKLFKFIEKMMPKSKEVAEKKQ